MGRLLLDTGAVQQRDIDKYKKQAAEIGKESFALAWVMDTGSEERERGVTVDIAQHFFTTETADFTILDAPGHRDFIANMIGGAMMADIVVLVVDANQLDSGLKGQTREHILLAYGVGIRKVVVAVNKLDASNPPWSRSLFDTVKEKISQLLTDIGFGGESIRFVPCSGLSGENVVKPISTKSAAASICVGSSSLVSALQSLAYDDKALRTDATTITPQEERIKDHPLRLQVADVYRGGIQNPLSVSGRLFGGSAVVGQKIVILPGADQAVIKGIQVASESRGYTVACEIASLHLDGDLETLNRNLRVGDMLTSTKKQITMIKAVSVRVMVLETVLPQTAELHFGRLHIASSIRRLVALVGPSGEIMKKSPRSLKRGQSALVEVVFATPVSLEVGNRVVLRADGSTIAFGAVEGVFSQ